VGERAAPHPTHQEDRRRGGSRLMAPPPLARRPWPAGLLAAALALTALAGPAAAEVKIGVLMPLSGKGASYGAHQQVAVKMFQDQLEKTAPKGEGVKLIAYDTRGENTDAINLTRKLIGSDRVVAIVGPLFSGESEGTFPVAVQGKTPIVTPTSAKPGIAAPNRPRAFRNRLTPRTPRRPDL